MAAFKPFTSAKHVARATCLLAAAAAIAGALAAPARAQNATTWTGGGTDTNWGTAANWNGGAPTTSGTWAITFSGTTRPTNIDNILPAITVSNLAINTGTGFTINQSSTASITLINGGTFSSTTNFSHGWYVPLTLSGTATFNLAGRVNMFGSTSGGTLVKIGSNQLQLYGSDYSTTAFKVQAGDLGFNSGSQTPLGPVSLEGGNLIFGSGSYALQVASSSNATIRGYGGQFPVFTSSTFNTQTAAASDVTLTLGGGNGGEIKGLVQDNTSKKVGLLINTANANWILSGSNSFSGGITISTGTLTANHASALGKGLVTVNNSGLLINGLTATAYGLAGSASGIIGSATNASVLSVDTTGQNTTFSGTIQNGSGTMGLTTLGTGKLTLGGANTYTGATTISGGTLALASTGSIASSGTVTVGSAGSTGAVLDLTAMTSSYAFGSGQTVKGIGTLNIGTGKTVSSAGIWAPGNSIGSNTVTGNLTLTGTSQFELGTPGTSTSAPGTADFTAASGTLTLGGNLALIDNANAGGFGTYGAGTYRLFTYGAVSGSYASITAANATTRGGIVLAGSGTSTGQGVFVNVYNLASAAASQTVNLGNTRVGTAITGSVTLTNSAPTNATFTETLSTGGFSNTTTNFTATGSASAIAGGTSGSGNLLVGLGSGLAAGAQSGTTTLALFSNAVNSSGLAQQSITAQTITITGGVYDYARASYTGGTYAFGNVRTGSAASAQTIAIGNSTITNASYQDLLNVSGSTTNSAVTATGFNNLAASTSGTSTQNLSLSANTATAGSLASTVNLSLVSNANGVAGLSNGTATTVGSPAAITTTGGVYDYARAKFSGATLDFGVVHLGASVTGQNVAFGNQTVTNASYQDSLDVSATTGNARVTATGFTGLAASSGGATTNNLAVSVSTATAGSLASTLSLTLTSNANSVAGLSNGTAVTVGGGSITTTGGVFSGTASWNVNGGGSWGTGASANWTSAESVSAAPGTFAGYTTTDSATFGTALTGGTASILLNGATPSLASIAFANTAGRYVLDQGSGGSLTLAAASGKPTVSVVAGALNEIKTAILGTSGLEKTGLGTLVLSGSSTYSGGTDITAGTLAVNGSLGGAVNVANGAVLGGSGVLSGLVTVAAGGILAPGNSPGTLSLNSGLALDASSILNFELNATNATVGSGVNDLINVTGNFTLAGILNVSGIGDFSTAADFTTWRLFNYSGGTFTNNTLTLGSTPSVGSTGKYFQIDTSTPNQVNLVIVPEPGALALAGVGIGIAGWLVRRRKK